MTPCVLGLAFVLIALSGGVRSVAAQDTSQETTPCEEALGAAESAYLNGNFQEAIRLVSPCLDRDDVSEDQVVQAYRLLSLAHLQQNEMRQARAAIVNIFGIRPEYEADPVEDPPSYVSLVSIVRRDVQPAAAQADEEEPAQDESTPFFRRTSTWLSIAGSLLVGGVVTIVTLGGGDDGGGGGNGGEEPGQLPTPPGTPSGN